MTSEMQAEKAQAAQWFKTLRDDIVSAFQSLEDSHSVGLMNDKPAGAFEVTKTTRHSDDGTDAGGDGRTKRDSGDGGRPKVLGVRDFPCCSHAEPALPCCPYEHAHVLDATCMVVRGWIRS